MVVVAGRGGVALADGYGAHLLPCLSLWVNDYKVVSAKGLVCVWQVQLAALRWVFIGKFGEQEDGRAVSLANRVDDVELGLNAMFDM